MNRRALRALLRGSVAACALILSAQSGMAQQTRPAPLPHDLGQTLFVFGNAALDRDNDGLKDNLEAQLAGYFKPWLIFDDRETVRLSGEPHVLFQVRPEGCIGEGCEKPWLVWISYSFLFRKDGGYTSSCSPCTRDGWPFGHDGDNDRLRIQLESTDGRNWRVIKIENGFKGLFVWPCTQAKFDRGHVQVYLSAEKHHHYFEATDCLNSPYSGGPGPTACNDGVNGRGYKTLPGLVSKYADERYNNVGEPESHSPSFFIGDLAPFGFAGEDAWGADDFLSPDATPMKDLWLTHNFSLGRQFCIYTSSGARPLRKRLSVSLLKVKRLEDSSAAPTNSFAFDVVVNGQRHHASGPRNINLGSTIILKRNIATVNGPLACFDRLTLSIEALNQNSLLGKFEAVFAGQTDFGRGQHTVVISRSVPVDPQGFRPREREEKLFEVTFRIDVVTVIEPSRRARPTD